MIPKCCNENEIMNLRWGWEKTIITRIWAINGVCYLGLESVGIGQTWSRSFLKAMQILIKRGKSKKPMSNRNKLINYFRWAADLSNATFLMKTQFLLSFQIGLSERLCCDDIFTYLNICHCFWAISFHFNSCEPRVYQSRYPTDKSTTSTWRMKLDFLSPQAYGETHLIYLTTLKIVLWL